MGAITKKTETIGVGVIEHENETGTAKPVSERSAADALESAGGDLARLAVRLQTMAGLLKGTVLGAVDICDGSCAAATRYRAAIRDTVQVLERTRTSFKSKELGALRRSLEALLFDRPETPRS